MDRQRSFFGGLGRQPCRLQDHPPAAGREVEFGVPRASV
jgi:hypothetical protein